MGRKFKAHLWDPKSRGLPAPVPVGVYPDPPGYRMPPGCHQEIGTTGKIYPLLSFILYFWSRKGNSEAGALWNGEEPACKEFLDPVCHVMLQSPTSLICIRKISATDIIARPEDFLGGWQ